MSGRSGEQDATRFAGESLARGDPTGWFERLYRAAADGSATVPWDRGAPNVLLVDWFAESPLPVDGARAVVVGGGPGRDAEYLAGLGFATTAFDISPTAVAQAGARHPGSPVDYRVADLLLLPAGWLGAFELVAESHNVQALPPALHLPAIEAVASLVAPQGTLRVLGAVAGHGEPADGPPWPLIRDEVEAFGAELRTVSLDQVPDPSGESLRWKAEFRRA